MRVPLGPRGFESGKIMKIKQLTLSVIILLAVSITVKAGKKPVVEKWIKKIEKLAPSKPIVPPKKKHKALLFSLHTGFNHWVIPHTSAMIRILGEKSSVYDLVESNDVEMFEPGKIRQFDLIILNNNCSKGPGRDLFFDVTKDKEKAALLEKSLIDHIAKGRGLVALHGAIVMQNNSPEFSSMLGGSFDFHPKNQKISLELVEPDHPILKVFNGKPLIHRDEPYLFKNAYTDLNFHPLLEIDVSKLNWGKKARKSKEIKPIKRYAAWIKKYKKGRVFYCSPSHNAQSFENPALLQFILNGIQYAAGDLECDDTPLNK